MKFIKYLYLLSFAVTLLPFRGLAQDRPIGFWRSFLPYNSAVGVATDGNIIYTISEQGFFRFNPVNWQMDTYSKVEGMSDNGMKCIAYDMATSTVVLVYSNGNIDLFKDNTFYNVPDLKIKTVAGSKNVAEVYTLNGLAYLSTDLGIVVVDIENHDIKETFEFSIDNQTIPVKSFVAKGDSFYAVTTNGVYSANRFSNELQNFQIWKLVDPTKTFNFIANFQDEIYLSGDSTIFRLEHGALTLVYQTQERITHIDGLDNLLTISEYNDSTYRGTMWSYTRDSGVHDSLDLDAGKSVQVAKSLSGDVWISDILGGLLWHKTDGVLAHTIPSGPLNSNSFDIYANDRDLWVTHGGYRDLYLPIGIRSGMFNYHEGEWTYYKEYESEAFNGVIDVSVFLKDEQTGTIYAGSYQNGLVVINSDGSYQRYGVNSIFDPSISIGNEYRQVIGLGLDSKRNLWVSTMFSQHQLYAKTPDDQWYKFKVPGAEYGGPLLVDDNDNIWFINFSDGGLTVYDPNGTVGDLSDDFSYHLSVGKGFGNLPSNTVNCIAKDKNGNIWVGTSNGIGIVNNCYSPFDQTPPCDAEIPIVQYDDYAGYLFATNNVRTIAVDGANRKWVGTDDGIWLLSPDAGEIVLRFTTDNSPLPSNRIQKIAIDKVTGDVYVGTEKGLVSFRSTATEGGKSNKNVLSYPNPVPAGYSGTIAIKGLVDGADVRITDISGQLVYRTQALGGQAVWDGRDYTGRKPQSGVYMIFASDKEGNETYTGKLVFLK